ncbi:MAG: hypothetical protein M1541_14540 [Acidobacteria bacterium]|nr:hypothetical protein [Acidobacteriota bacterium]
MVVRIRFGHGHSVRRGRGKNRHLAWAAGALLTPGAVMAFALAMWRLAADMGWAREFAVSEGLLSHWQVWLAISVLLELGAWMLNRYGAGGASNPGTEPVAAVKEQGSPGGTLD